MKKIVLLLTVLALGSSTASAHNLKEFLNEASPADLLNLRNKVDEAILASDSWESVNVPAGTYQAGVHIPAGKWAVRAGYDDAWCSMMVGEKLESNGKTINYFDSESYFSFSLANEYLYDDVDILQSTIEIFELPDEYYVEISMGSVIFEPYSGNPNFQFYAKELPETKVINDVEVDEYTLEELAELKNDINLALWNSYSWDKVLVPSGIYTVGENIPEGEWKVEPPSESTILIKYGSSLNKHQMNLDVSYDGWFKVLASEDSNYYSKGDETKATLKMDADYYVCLNNGIYAWFSPNAETVSLGFKAFGGPTNVDNSESSVDFGELSLFEID